MEKILVIDDDKLIRDCIKEFFQLEEFIVDSAIDGLDGINKTKENLYDFIICDIDMPILNGYEVIKHIKNDDRYLNIPFVFLTGKMKSSEIIKGLKLGADDYLTKPFEYKEIIDIVKSKISKKRRIDNLIEEKLNQIKSSISFSLPHEFITPINGILGPISMLIDDNQMFSEDEIREMHNVIYQSANRIKLTTEKFLIYNELDFTKMDIDEYEVINVKDEITAIYERSCVVRERGNDIQFDLDNLEISFNQKYFNILIKEILQNAFKFSNYGDKIYCKTDFSKGYLVLNITDYGRGISEVELRNIDAFVQFDRKSYEQQGIGLGIAIIKKIAKIFDLNIEYKSNKNEFTSVSIIFNNKNIIKK